MCYFSVIVVSKSADLHSICFPVPMQTQESKHTPCQSIYLHLFGKKIKRKIVAKHIQQFPFIWQCLAVIAARGGVASARVTPYANPPTQK